MIPSILKILVLLMIMSAYFKTEKALPIAIVWGVLSLFLHGQYGWIATIFLSLISFLVAWGVFSLAAYVENSILFRMLTLGLGMVIMLMI